MRTLTKTIYALGILITAIGCGDNLTEKNDVEKQILRDQDFITMIATAYAMNTEIDQKTKNPEITIKIYENTFSKYLNILSVRYDKFHDHAQRVLADNTSPEYLTFKKTLSDKIILMSSFTNSRISYDGSSVCNQPCPSATSATACITGCYYAEVYCMGNGGGRACPGLLENCKQQCCDSFCKPL